MSFLRRLISLIDRVNEWMGQVFSFLAIALTLLVVYDVVVRYFFARPTIWGLEMSCIILTWITFLGSGYSFLHGSQVKVDFFYQKLSPRQKAGLDLITHLFFFAFCLVLVWFGGQVAWESLKEGRLSTSAWAPPLWPSQIMIPLGGLLIGLQGLAKWLRDFSIIWTGQNVFPSKFVTGEGGLFEKEKK